MPRKNQNNTYTVIIPSSGKGKKEIQLLYQCRKVQLEKAIKKLEVNPIDFTIKGIEKIDNAILGQYTIRVSKGDRIFYDVDRKYKKVYILRAGKHDLYRLI